MTSWERRGLKEDSLGVAVSTRRRSGTSREVGRETSILGRPLEAVEGRKEETSTSARCSVVVAVEGSKTYSELLLEGSSSPSRTGSQGSRRIPKLLLHLRRSRI